MSLYRKSFSEQLICYVTALIEEPGFELLFSGRGPFEDDYYRIYYVCTYSFDPETDDLVLHVIGYLYGEGAEKCCPEEFIVHFRNPDYFQYKDSKSEDFYDLIFER